MKYEIPFPVKNNDKSYLISCSLTLSCASYKGKGFSAILKLFEVVEDVV